MHNFNKGISTERFPDILKIERVKPVFKKESKIDKPNYRPVSTLCLKPPKLLKDWFLSNQCFFIQSFLNICAVWERS